MSSAKLRVLCPIDFSERSLRAFDQAVAWAARAPCELNLVHVVHDGASVVGELVQSYEELMRVAEAELAKLGARGDLGAAELERHVAWGRPAPEILRLAARLGVDLIIMGTHGRTGLRRLLLGSVAEEVIRRAPCPVLCVPLSAPPAPVDPATWRRLLCAVDFSETSHRAMASAMAVARHLGIDVLLVHAFHAPVLPGPEGVMAPPDLVDDVAVTARAQLDDWQREAQALAGPGVTVSAVAVLGGAAEAIVRLAHEQGCGVIVVGTHGRTGLLHLVMGSVAARVVRTARCPVLTIHPAQALFAEEPAAGPGAPGA